MDQQNRQMGQARATIELSIVVPVYNEENALPIFMQRIRPVLESITQNYELIFCMDPGRDRTRDIIEAEIAKDPRIRLLTMTRRWGQNACMMAGIELCSGDACVIIDVDLQDPPEIIAEMYKKWKHEGYNVVYGQRRTRKGELASRRAVAWLGYWLINRISEVPIPRNTGDFRLIDRKVIEGLRQLRETHGFLRGLIPYVGYRQTTILFDREERKAGETKYNPVLGSLRHGWDGIVAFSIRPLSFVTAIGMVTAGLGFLMTLIYIGRKLITGQAMLTGLGPIMLLVTLLGGVQLICFGIMGEYIGRIYEEVRERPRYMIAERINFP